VLELRAIKEPKPRSLLSKGGRKYSLEPIIGITTWVTICSKPSNAVSKLIADVALVARNILGDPRIAKSMLCVDEQMAPYPSNMKVSIGIPLSKDLVPN
jgi:hypothetical protein